MQGILTAINCEKHFYPLLAEKIANINTLIKGGYVICTSVVPCLSGGFAKINKIISMFVLFSQDLAYFESSAFFKKWGIKPHTKAVKQNVCSQFLKVQQLSRLF